MSFNQLQQRCTSLLFRTFVQRQLSSRNSSVLAYVGSNRDLPVMTATKQDHPSVVDFLLQNFRVEEPTTRALQLTTTETLQLFSVMADEALADPVSFIVRNAKQEIVCCRLSSIIRTKTKKPINLILKGNLSEKTANLMTFLDNFEKDLSTTLPAYDKLFKLMIVSVRSDLFRQGIAKDLYPLSVRLARDHNCQGIITTATSYRTQQLYATMGFMVVKTIMHADYRDTRGHRIITTDDQTNCGKLMFLPLKDNS